MSILRKRLEEVFDTHLASAVPGQAVMRGHDTSDREVQPGVTVICRNNREADGFPSRSGVYEMDMSLIVESNVQDPDNTQSSIETLITNLTDAVEDLTAIQALCALSFTDIYIHDILPGDDTPEVEGYNLDNVFNYILVFEYLNV